ncbi:Cleavage and polyadenylation specificity factor subunit 1 [Thoreauomyces humboldtii]|nr:Cleavage and polyadenylation specificity factor subunit 1 [Thoreauomyces humboldtii]
MTSTYSLYKELLPPSGIEACVEARFISPSAVNLIVARDSVLQIYTVIEDDFENHPIVQAKTEDLEQTSDDASEEMIKSVSRRPRGPRKIARLELHAQFRLQGNVTSMGVVRTSTSNGLKGMDSLLLSFRDAKMSLIEWSPATYNIVTVSIHYYERDEFKKEHLSDKFIPEIRVDPQNRCAIMQFYSDRLAILPLKQDGAVQVTELDDATSFVVPFSAIDAKMRNVCDMVFLYGYFEPVLAILYEPVQTWTGRLAARKDTKCLIVVSLDITQRTYPVLFRVDNLPYNCTNLMAVPSPVGGVLIFSSNAMIHVDQTSVPGVVCQVNPYYGRETRFPAPPAMEAVGHIFETKNPLYDPSLISDYKTCGISLDAAASYFLNPDTLLTVLRTGELIKVDLKGGEGAGRGWKRRKGGVKRFELTRLGIRTVQPSCGTRFGATGSGAGHLEKVASAIGRIGGTFQNEDEQGTFGYFFVGSRVADATLVQFTETQTETMLPVVEVTQNDAKPMGPMDDANDMDLDDIYGDAIASTLSTELAAASSSLDGLPQQRRTTSTTTRFTFRICDSLICTGPIRDLVVGEPVSYSTHRFAEPAAPQADLEVVTCVGEGTSGALGVLQCNIRPQIISSFEMEGVTNMWTVRCRKPEVKPDMEQETTDMDLDGTPAPASFEENLDEDSYDAFMVLSKEQETIVLETGQEFAEVEGKDFYTTGPTIAVGTVLDGDCIVQVHPGGIVVLDVDGTKTQELPIGEDGRWIVSCSFLDPYVMVLLNVGEIMLFTVNVETRTLRLCRELKDLAIMSCSLYSDEGRSNVFPTIKELIGDIAPSTLPTKAPVSVPTLKTPPMKAARKAVVPVAPDLDSDLYGTVEMSEIYGASDELGDYLEDEKHEEKEEEEAVDAMMVDQPDLSTEEKCQNGTETGMWCFVYREDGALEIFSLPEFEQCYVVPRFDLLPTMAFDQPHSSDPRHANSDPAVKFEELIVVNLGRDAEHAYPYLMGRTTHSDLILYRIYVHLPTEADEPHHPVTPGNPPLTPHSAQSSSHQPLVLATAKHRLAIRLVRVPHDHISRSAQLYTDTEGDKLHPVDVDLEQPTESTGNPFRSQKLTPFRNVGLKGALSYSGVFVSGQRPCWVMVAGTGGVGPQFDIVERPKKATSKGEGEEAEADVVANEEDEDEGEINATVEWGTCGEPPLPVTGKNALRVHPQVVDGAVQGFAPLHNVNVPNGFAYINGEGQLRICQLPAHFTYDAEWAYCKVPLGRNAHRITYHYGTQTYVVATSTPIPFSLATAQHAAAVAAGVIEVGDDLPEVEGAKRGLGVKDDEREEGLYMPTVGAYSIELVSPVTWETSDAIQMDEHEHILAMQAVELESKQTASGRKMFLAIGTGVIRAEDLAARGRILVYDIISVVPDPAHPHANHRFKRLFVTEEKSPVTALCNVGGYLLAAIGTKIIIHSFEDNENLTGVAFIDVNMYVNTVTSIKNLILVGDIMKSVWFLGFQEDPPKLAMLGKDHHSLNVYGLEFMVEDASLSFVVGDGDCNLHVMSYAPYHIQSSSGQKLIRRGDIHTGQHVSKILRLGRVERVDGSSELDADGEKKTTASPSTVCRQQVCLSGTLEGGLLLMLPVTEKLYKRLYGLYSKMVNALQHPAGLNPRGFRQVALKSRPPTAAIATPMTGPPGPRLVLDGELLYGFQSLSQNQQRELGKGIGSRVDRILDDLLEVVAGVEYF